jgi:hypothetical protein
MSTRLHQTWIFANSDKDLTSRCAAFSTHLVACLVWSLWLVACSATPDPGAPRNGEDEDVVTQEEPSRDGTFDAGADAPSIRRDGAAEPSKRDAASGAARAPLDGGVRSRAEASFQEPTTDGQVSDAGEARATDGAAGGSLSSGALPPLSSPGEKGPFAIEVKESLEGLATHILIAPKELGRDGIKHPVLVWVNGAGADSSSYRAMLDNVAAHGFFLLDDKQSTFEVPPEVQAQRAAIDWAIAQNEKQGGPYFGKLDTTRIAIGGHSLGSVSTFGNVGDARIKTSIHMAGGLLGNPQGVDEGWMKGLHVPAAFLCGDRDMNGIGRVRRDFAGAPPSVPVYFGLLAGAGHTDEFNKENGGRWGRVVVAWLRWQLAGDANFAKFFQGPDCEFCKGDWTAMKRNLD